MPRRPTGNWTLSEPVPFRAGGFAPRDIQLAGAATLVGVLAAWQAAASLGWISTRFLSDPFDIGRALWSPTVSGGLLARLSALLLRLSIGSAVGPIACLVLWAALELFSPRRS